MIFSAPLKTVLVYLLIQMPLSIVAISVDSQKNARQAIRIYTTVADRYAPFLEVYYQKEQAPYREQDFYAKQLIAKITDAVLHDKLVLYGNFLSRAWRTLSSCSSQYVLKQFDQKYLEDALGHVQKQYNQLLEADFHSAQLRNLIADLSKLRDCIRQTSEYKLEEQSMACDELKAQLSTLKRQISEHQEKLGKLETELTLKDRQIRGYY